MSLAADEVHAGVDMPGEAVSSSRFAREGFEEVPGTVFLERIRSQTVELHARRPFVACADLDKRVLRAPQLRDLGRRFDLDGARERADHNRSRVQRVVKQV